MKTKLTAWQIAAVERALADAIASRNLERASGQALLNLFADADAVVVTDASIDDRRIESARTALIAGNRARLATRGTGIGCKNIHAPGSLNAFMWDAGYTGSRRTVSRLFADFEKGAGR